MKKWWRNIILCTGISTHIEMRTGRGLRIFWYIFFACISVSFSLSGLCRFCFTGLHWRLTCSFYINYRPILTLVPVDEKMVQDEEWASVFLFCTRLVSKSNLSFETAFKTMTLTLWLPELCLKYVTSLPELLTSRQLCGVLTFCSSRHYHGTVAW